MNGGDHERRIATLETKFARHEREHEDHESRTRDLVRKETADVIDGVKRIVSDGLKPVAELPSRVGAIEAIVARIEDKTDGQTAMLIESAEERGMRKQREADESKLRAKEATELEKHKAKSSRIQVYGVIAVGLLTAACTALGILLASHH